MSLNITGVQQSAGPKVKRNRADRQGMGRGFDPSGMGFAEFCWGQSWGADCRIVASRHGGQDGLGDVGRNVRVIYSGKTWGGLLLLYASL